MNDPNIERYQDGPALLCQAIEGLTPEEINAFPIPGTWSIRQVVCHLADAEILYADRMKRILTEEKPMLLKADPARFLATLAVDARNIEDELELITLIRRQVSTILATLKQDQWERIGIHSTDGPMTFRTVLERAANHVPHHVSFIYAKRDAILARRR